MRGRKVPPRGPSVLCEGHHSPSMSAVCGHPAALCSSAAGSLPLRKPAVGTSPPARLLRSRSSVSLRLVYTWPLFLHTSAGVNPAGSVPGVQEAARWAAGADSVGASPPQTAPERQCKACGQERSTFDPAMGRPGPGPVGRLPTHAVGLCRGLGA